MHLDLTGTWVGFLSIAIFITGYFFIATEDKYRINKAKPALFIGTLIFILIGIYFFINGLDKTYLHHELEILIVEIAGIFFFLFVAMTYIEAMIDRKVFLKLRFWLLSKKFNFIQLFWITGFLAFFISPIADNLTTALILSTVLITIDKTNLKFIVPSAINVVVAANAGGAWSPFGDITTLMVWVDGKGSFTDFLYLFPASFVGWIITAYLLSRYIPSETPKNDSKEKYVNILKGGVIIIGLFIFTIFMAIISHNILHLSAMWGMMFGLAILKLYIHFLNENKEDIDKNINVFSYISKIENDTLLFFFGILAAVGGLHFLGYLTYFTHLYQLASGVSDNLVTLINIAVGFISAIIDNVPVMSAVLKSSPEMSHPQWMLVTLSAGIGGSLISFGSAAGVGVMGKLHGIYTFSSHMKFAWTILVGYFISIIIWYVQFQIFKIY